MKRFAFILIFLGVVLFSCQKNTEAPVNHEEQFKQETIETGICFNFVYPIIVEFRDGSTVRVQDNIQYRRLLASCDGQQCFGYVYPLSVVFRGGNTVVVNNDQQMRRVYNSCN